MTIGLIGPLTGPGAAWGVGLQQAVQLAIDETNKDGGLKVGGTTYTVALKAYDDKYLAADGLKALNSLIQQDKVNVVIGSIGGQVNKALVPVATQNKIVNLTDGQGDYLGPEYPYTFRVHPDISVYGPAAARWMVANTPGGVKAVSLLTSNDESGVGNAKPVTGGYEKAGASVKIDTYETGATDFTSVLTRVIQSRPDLIEAVGRPADAALIVKQARELGYEGPISHIGGPVQEAVLSVAGAQYAEGFTYAQPFDLSTTAFRNLEKKFSDTYQTDMFDYAPYFYDATFMLFKAMTQAGTVTDPDRIAAALRTVTFDSAVQGRISFGGEETWGCTCEIESPDYIARIKDGGFAMVAQVPAG